MDPVRGRGRRPVSESGAAVLAGDASRGAAPKDDGRPWRRAIRFLSNILPPAIAGVLLLGGAAILVARWGAFDRLGLIAVDLEIYLGYARRFLSEGSMYAETQSSPYVGQPYVSGPIPDDMPCLYPPAAIYLFAPFLVLPRIIWWLVPLGVMGHVLLRLRPARWTWPFIVAPLVTPEFAAGLATGNTGMWMVAAVAGGIEWGWPSIGVLLKPFLAPFALIGAGRRGWWIGLGIAIAISIPLISDWLAYPTIISNAGGLNYDPLAYATMLLVPVFGWLGSGRRRVAAANVRWPLRRFAGA